jgi:hypothetical protein
VIKDFDPETFKDEIYHAIKNNYRIRIPKKDLKDMRKLLRKLLINTKNIGNRLPMQNQSEYHEETA